MTRVKRGNKKLKRRKEVLKRAKGYHGKRKNCYRIAKQSVMKALKNAYIDRRRKKREFRKLWISRIGAAAKQRDFSYSKFMGGLNKEDVDINRKMLADIAVRDPETFDELVNVAKEAMEN